jgi:hypothetical protein
MRTIFIWQNNKVGTISFYMKMETASRRNVGYIFIHTIDTRRKFFRNWDYYFYFMSLFQLWKLNIILDSFLIGRKTKTLWLNLLLICLRPCVLHLRVSFIWIGFCFPAVWSSCFTNCVQREVMNVSWVQMQQHGVKRNSEVIWHALPFT